MALEPARPEIYPGPTLSTSWMGNSYYPMTPYVAFQPYCASYTVMYGGSVPYTANSVVLNGSYQGQVPAPGVGPPFVSSVFPVFNPIPTNLPYVFPTGQFSAPPFFGHPGYDPAEQTQQNVPYSSIPLPSAPSSMLPSASPSVPLPVPLPVPSQPAASPPHAPMFCPSCKTLSYGDPGVPRPFVCPTCGRRPFAEETAEKPREAAMESEAKRVKAMEPGVNPLKPHVNQLNAMNSMNSVNGMNAMNSMSGMDSMNAMKRMNGGNGRSSVSGINSLNAMNAMNGMNGLNAMNAMNAMNGVNLLSGERLDRFERRALFDPSGRLDPPLSAPSVFPRSAFSRPSHVPNVPNVPILNHGPIVPIIANHPTHPNHPTLLNSPISSASILHDVKLVLNSLLSRVEKIVLKEERQIQEDVQTIVSNLLTRVEQYTAGHLHCCCFQPSFVQRRLMYSASCAVRPKSASRPGMPSSRKYARVAAMPPSGAAGDLPALQAPIPAAVQSLAALALAARDEMVAAHAAPRGFGRVSRPGIAALREREFSRAAALRRLLFSRERGRAEAVSDG